MTVSRETRIHARQLRAMLLCAGLVLLMPALSAMETDQYIVLTVELEDSSEAINAYLNRALEGYLERVNAKPDPPSDAAVVAQDFYQYLFRGIHRSRFRSWVQSSPDLDRFPGDDINHFEYLNDSVYSPIQFPWYFMPMARTIRVGDVYCGVDKLSHVFGFGRRYHKRFLRHVAEGDSEEEAIEKIVVFGYWTEMYLMGGLADAMFSHADVEANYQGFLMLRAMSEGEDAHLKRVDGQWILAQPLDIRPFVTPGLDESYNLCRYSRGRKDAVPRTLMGEFAEAYRSPLARERFARYAAYPPSPSQEIVNRALEERGFAPYLDQELRDLIHGEGSLQANATGSDQADLSADSN